MLHKVPTEVVELIADCLDAFSRNNLANTHCSLRWLWRPILANMSTDDAMHALRGAPNRIAGCIVFAGFMRHTLGWYDSPPEFLAFDLGMVGEIWSVGFSYTARVVLIPTPVMCDVTSCATEIVVCFRDARTGHVSLRLSVPTTRHAPGYVHASYATSRSFMKACARVALESLPFLETFALYLDHWQFVDVFTSAGFRNVRLNWDDMAHQTYLEEVD